MVKNLPAMQENWVRSLGLEDTLEKEMATHLSILAWEIPWTEEPGRVARSQTHDWATNTFTFTNEEILAQKLSDFFLIHSEYFRYYWNLSIHIYASIFLPKLVIFHLNKNYSHPRPEDVKWYHIVALICFSSMTDEVGHLFMWLLAICKSFKKKSIKAHCSFFWLDCLYFVIKL